MSDRNKKSIEKTKIDSLIDEMIDYIEDVRSVPFSGDKIKISRDDILSFIDDIKLTLPEELDRAKKIIKSKKEIIEEANREAKEIIDAAKIEAKRLVDEHEIRLEAEDVADNIIAVAEEDANNIIKEAENISTNIRLGALNYSDKILGEIERSLEYAHRVMSDSTENLFVSLENNLDVLKENREELENQIKRTGEISEEIREEHKQVVEEPVYEEEEEEVYYEDENEED